MTGASLTGAQTARGPIFDRCRARDCGALAAFPYSYADSFRIRLDASDRRDLARLLTARGTGGVERALAALRDAIVRPFELKPIGAAAMAPFDLSSERQGAAILGVDDGHADVRLVYQLEERQGQRELVATTLVRTHGALGRAYLAAILPFHFLIVKRQLSRIAKADPGPAPSI